MDMKVESDVSPQGRLTARKFGLVLDEKHLENPKCYTSAFLSRLLCLRDKMKLGLFDSQLSDQVKTSWQKLLSLLEDRSRRVVGLTPDSVTFILFTPTKKSSDQLQEKPWSQELKTALISLASEIGINLIEITIQIKNPGATFRQKDEFLQALQRNWSTCDSESGGSSEMNPSLKVEEWLRAKTTQWLVDKRELRLEKRWDFHSQSQGEIWYATFAVGESGSIGISFSTEEDGLIEGYLSALLTDSPEVSLISKVVDNWSPVVISQPGKVHLAVCVSNKIYTYDMATNKSKLVFSMQSETKWPKNLCLIDKDTVACAEYVIYLLDASKEPWSLMATIVPNEGKTLIYDMCHVKTFNGTPLLLCCLDNKQIQAFELGSGRSAWKVDRDQMGQKCIPRSICAGEDTAVYVADFWQNKLYLLSAEDGAVIGTINLLQFDIKFPVCVRMQDDFLYIFHKNGHEMSKWQISKYSIAPQ